jgi:transcriptional regulator with XRE-family HTH domain
VSDTRPGELADTLRRLRDATHPRVSGEAAAAKLGKSQASLSRYERGQQMPTEVDVRTLCRLYGAPPEVTTRLLRLVRDLRADPIQSARVVMHRGGAGRLQRRIRRFEEASRRVAVFQPLLVPGLLQTEAYMRAVFATGDEMPAAEQRRAVEERLARQAILAESGRAFLFLMPEGALAWQLGSPAVMAEQCDRLAVAATSPQVRLGVIVAAATVDEAPTHGFELYDETAVIVGTTAATAVLVDRADVAVHARLLAGLERAATFGDAARAVFADHAERYRSLT